MILIGGSRQIECESKLLKGYSVSRGISFDVPLTNTSVSGTVGMPKCHRNHIEGCVSVAHTMGVILEALAELQLLASLTCQRKSYPLRLAVTGEVAPAHRLSL